MRPTIRPMKPLPVRLPFWMAFSPQKVKKMVVGMPAAAEAEARVKPAKTLSKSPLIWTIIVPFFASMPAAYAFLRTK